MTSMLSRTTVLRDFFRRNKSSKQECEEDVVCGENTDYKESEEKSEFDGNYMLHIDELDKDLCINNPEEFNKMLNYFWDGVSNYIFDLDIILDTLCNTFPRYTKEIYESCYRTLIQSCDIYYDFALLMETMADWDESNNSSYFSRLVEDTYEELIASMDIGSPYADFVWILENRFLIDSEKVEKCMRKLFEEIYMNYSLIELVCENALDQLFKLPYGYSMFFDYILYIMHGYDGESLLKLQEDYCIDLDIECKVNVE